MTKQEFLNLLIEELEIEEQVEMASNFRELEDWSSLMGFSLLACLEENFNKNMSVDEFLKINTFEEIYQFVERQ